MNTPITAQTTVATLADLWLQQLRTEGRLARTTINEYERVLRNLVIPNLGPASLGALTTSRIDEVLTELGTKSLNHQRKAKVVTGAMIDAAVDLGALSVNPIRGSLSIRRPPPEDRSLTMAELEGVRAAVRAWLNKDRSGPKPSGDIADIIELMLAIGARIGEVLALRWADIDLSTKVVEINATIKTEAGVGTYRRPLSRPRMVALPESAALLLQSRRRSMRDNFLDAVFPTRNVTWQQVNNVQRCWRQIRRDTGLEWVTTEALRRPHRTSRRVGPARPNARQRRRPRLRGRSRRGGRLPGRPDRFPGGSRPAGPGGGCAPGGPRG